MWDMPPVLAEQAAAYGIKDHTIAGLMRIGVSRTSQHWNSPEPNQAKQALRDGKVDVFVTSNLVHPDEGIDNFVKLGIEHNPNMRFLMQISWPGLGYTDNEQFNAGGRGGPGGGIGGGGLPGFGGGRGFVAQGPVPGAGARGGVPGGAPGGIGGFGGGAGQRGGVPGGAPGGIGGFGGGGGGGRGGMFPSGDGERTPEQLAGTNAIDIKNAEEQAKKLNAQIGKTAVFLVPTAQAHTALRTLIYKKEIPGMTSQGEVFIDTIGHPTAPMITLNAYLHFSVLYKRSPVGLPMPTVLKNAARPEWNSDKLNRKLQELAWEIVSNYPPSGVSVASK
jgi:hypothetical protein